MLGLLLGVVLANPTQIRVLDDAGQKVAPFADPAKPTVLIYVLDGCPISAKYSPEIGRLVRDYPKVRFYLVHTDPQTTVARAKAHRAEFHIPCPELLDRRHELVKLAKPTAVPTVALFDANRRIRYQGRIDDRFPALGIERAKPARQDLRIALDEVLAGKAVSVPRTVAVGCSLPRL